LIEWNSTHACRKSHGAAQASKKDESLNSCVTVCDDYAHVACQASFVGDTVTSLRSFAHRLINDSTYCNWRIKARPIRSHSKDHRKLAGYFNSGMNVEIKATFQ
jgi:hypothetical protein